MLNTDNLPASAGPRSARSTATTSVVLVHGACVDGSGWRGVYDILKKGGHDVTVVQNPTRSLTDDVAFTKRAIAAANGKVILVGHSYGGVVVSEAGNDPKVAGLVYVAAFVPDQGESVASLSANPAPGAPVPPFLPPQDGYLMIDRSKLAEAFGADLDPDDTEFITDSLVPWSVDALNGAVTLPAWKSKDSWYLVTKDDKMIPPPVQRAMAQRAGSHITEIAGGHAIYISNPAAVAALIEQAAQGISGKAQ